MSNVPDDVEISQIQVDLAGKVTPYCLVHVDEWQDKTKGFCSVCNENLYYNCSKCTTKKLTWSNFETSFHTLRHVFEEYKQKKDFESLKMKETNGNQETEQMTQNIEDMMKGFGNNRDDRQKFKSMYVHLEYRLESTVAATVECMLGEFNRIQQNPIRYLYEKDDVSSILLDLYEKTKFNSELHKKMEQLLLTCDDIVHISKFDGSERIYFQNK